MKIIIEAENDEDRAVMKGDRKVFDGVGKFVIVTESGDTHINGDPHTCIGLCAKATSILEGIRSQQGVANVLNQVNQAVANNDLARRAMASNGGIVRG